MQLIPTDIFNTLLVVHVKGGHWCIFGESRPWVRPMLACMLQCLRITAKDAMYIIWPHHYNNLKYIHFIINYESYRSISTSSLIENLASPILTFSIDYVDQSRVGTVAIADSSSNTWSHRPLKSRLYILYIGAWLCQTVIYKFRVDVDHQTYQSIIPRWAGLSEIEPDRNLFTKGISLFIK